MEPRIQYCKTSDGVNIAFASMGEGPPLVRVPIPGLSHVQREWTLLSHVFAPLVGTFRIILYDARGAGLSDRDAIDFSMEAMMRDLEALIDPDWTLYTETMARVLSGIDDPHLVEFFGEHIRASIEPEAFRAFVEAEKSYDVVALLPDVKAATLVLHNNNHRWAPIRVGQKLAADIPDARFLAIDDMNYERVAPLVEEFAGTTEKSDSVEPGAFRTVLFTDVEGSTALTQRLGDAKAR